MDVSLVNATLENMELLAGVSIPQQQNQYVNFELSAVGYEIAGNPWAFIILADGCVAGYLCCDELQGGELMIKKFVTHTIRRFRLLNIMLTSFLTVFRVQTVKIIFTGKQKIQTGQRGFGPVNCGLLMRVTKTIN